MIKTEVHLEAFWVGGENCPELPSRVIDSEEDLARIKEVVPMCDEEALNFEPIDDLADELGRKYFPELCAEFEALGLTWQLFLPS
jgi:hypothetical protein